MGTVLCTCLITLAGFTLIRVRFAHMPIALQIAPGEVEQLYGRDLQMEDIRVGCTTCCPF